MTKTKRTRIKLMDRALPNYSKKEELFNFISHAVAGGFAIAALVLCVVMGATRGNVWGVVSGAIYGFTLILLYTMSSLYHGLTQPKAKRVFQVIDHCAIFLLIAGSYTPITLSALRPAYPVLAWVIFGIIWGFAILGIVLNAIDLKMFSKFSMICYLGMGWCIIFAIKPMAEVIHPTGLLLLLLGGISYTVGAVLYAIGKRKVPFMHAVFHVFVFIGSVFHFFLIFLYILPVK